VVQVRGVEDGMRQVDMEKGEHLQENGTEIKNGGKEDKEVGEYHKKIHSCPLPPACPSRIFLCRGKGDISAKKAC
jgi:hypothetical protein